MFPSGLDRGERNINREKKRKGGRRERERETVKGD